MHQGGGISGGGSSSRGTGLKPKGRRGQKRRQSQKLMLHRKVEKVVARVSLRLQSEGWRVSLAARSFDRGPVNRRTKRTVEGELARNGCRVAFMVLTN